MSEVVLRRLGETRWCHIGRQTGTQVRRNYQNGSLLVSVEGETKSFLPLALFIMNIIQVLGDHGLGKSGMVYRRGLQIVLENEKTGEHVAVKVVMHDSMQGWLAENGEGDWQWYRINNEHWPNETDYWRYIKKVGT